MQETFTNKKLNGSFSDREKKLQTVIKELSEINQKREKELKKLDSTAKLLTKRDLELTEMRERKAKEMQEIDRIAKMLIRRDLELSEVREQREKELEQLQRGNIELERSRRALINILEDVEEARNQAEEEKDKTLAVITNLSDGLLVFDRSNKLSLVNSQAENFLDTSAEEITGKRFSELSKITAIEPMIKAFGNPIKGIKEIFRKEIKLKKSLILEISAVPVMRGEEKIGALVILHDITREKAIERMKTEFVSLAAHQLRTPLSAIKWTLRMLLDGDLGKITEEQRNFIDKTYFSNERMIALINDLLDVTRIEEGRFLYKPVLASIEDITHFVVSSYEGEIKRRGLKLEVKKPKLKLPRIRVDVEKIRLAVQNLLDNAMQYTPAGGILTITLSEQDKNIEFKIEDTGIGIPTEQQARVFDKFFRGANAQRKETKGSGLGLFITKNIIEAHKGRIWFESKKGKGAVFYFTLPIKKEGVAEFLKEF